MGDVVAKMRVTPKQGVNIAKLEKEIAEKIKPKDIQEVPIGFGLVQLELLVLFKGGEGDTDQVEKELRKIKGVGEVSSEGVTLL